MLDQKDNNNKIVASPNLDEMDKCQTMQEKFLLYPPEIYYSEDGKGLAKLFADIIHPYLRFNIDHEYWMYYDGMRWAQDKADKHIKMAAKTFAGELDNYIPTLGTYSFKEKDNIGSASVRNSLIRDATDIHTVEDKDFDVDPDLFNCVNGTINVRTGTFLPHSSEDMLATVANVTYNPGAESTLLDDFFNKIFDGDDSRIRYVLRALSLCLTGHTNEHCLFIFWGKQTRNGKSTLTNSFAHMLGEYAVNIDISTLAQRRYYNGSAPSSDVARIKGKRFILASEPSQDFVFDESRTKALTGGDKLTARFLHQNHMEFQPVGKIFIGTNYRPIIEDDALLQSKRIRIIPFDHFFSPEEQDIKLPDKLKQPDVMSALLNKCLEAYQEYLTIGLKEPKIVLDTMEGYQTRTALIKTFFETELIKGNINDKIPLAKIYPIYSSWCASNSLKAEKKHKFGDLLRKFGILADSATIGSKTIRNVVIGYRLRQDNIVESKDSCVVIPLVANGETDMYKGGYIINNQDEKLYIKKIGDLNVTEGLQDESDTRHIEVISPLIEEVDDAYYADGYEEQIADDTDIWNI